MAWIRGFLSMTNLKKNSCSANLFSSGCGRVPEFRMVQEKPDERLKWSSRNRCRPSSFCHTAQPSSPPGPAASLAVGNLTAVHRLLPQTQGFQTHRNLRATGSLVYRPLASTSPISKRNLQENSFKDYRSPHPAPGSSPWADDNKVYFREKKSPHLLSKRGTSSY